MTDIYDPDLYVEAVPHDRLRALRRSDPVFRQELPDGQGFWALLRHADVVAASRDWQTFSAARGGIVIEDQAPERLAALRTMLLSMDPPEHGRLRRGVLDAFTAARVEAMEPWLRQQASAIMDAAAERRDCDFVRDLAGELPLQTINQMMGVPEVDRGRIVALGDRIIGANDPDVHDGTASFDASTELGAYGYQLACERKSAAADDLISTLMRTQFEGHPLTEVEFAAVFVQLAVAGNETTRTLLTGAMLALLDHPEAYRALEHDYGLLPVATEEMLRWVTPVHYFRRTATRDVAVRGRQIREGDRVVLHYTSANRDEDVFADPDRFDVCRDPNPHVAFGFGEHFCLGARLARLEIRVFFEAFFDRFAGIELTGSPRRLRSNLNNAYKSVPVRLTPR